MSAIEGELTPNQMLHQQYERWSVGSAAFDMMRKLQMAHITEGDCDNWTAYVADTLQLTDANDIIPELVVLTRKTEPEPINQEKITVGSYVVEYDGDSVQFDANCNSLAWIDDDGCLVIEDPDRESSCVVRMDTLLQRAKSLREAYDERMAKQKEEDN